MQPPTDHGFFRGTNRIIGGVCSGLAESLHVDPIWVRLAFVVLAFAQGVGILLYVILWVVMPERGRPTSAQSTLDSIAADLRRAWEDVRRQFGGSAASPQSTPAAAKPSGDASSSVPSSPLSASSASPVPPSTVTSTAPAATQNWYWLLGVILIAVGLVYLVINSGLLEWSVIWPVVLIGLGILLLVRNLDRRR